KRAVRAKRDQESGNAFRIGSVGRRKDPAIDVRQPLVLHLPPAPRHAFPESPVVIVIAGAVEREAVAAHLNPAAERARHARDGVARYPAACSAAGFRCAATASRSTAPAITITTGDS